ncbi:uncharacterized protein EDB91DRAFT_82515, partial [Suillus paluster]|uniref:uncharacterized protein n=1 Tax=Suillus paluster TaxID=48578 RepID=UPI001B85FAD4
MNIEKVRVELTDFINFWSLRYSLPSYIHTIFSNLTFGSARHIATRRGFATTRILFSILFSRFAGSSRDHCPQSNSMERCSLPCAVYYLHPPCAHDEPPVPGTRIHHGLHNSHPRLTGMLGLYEFL